MCKFNPKNEGRRIDPCLEIPLIVWEWAINKKKIKLVGSCCGHEKYHKTLIAKKIKSGQAFDLISGVPIPRKTKFYRKDKQGIYYVPEVEEHYALEQGKGE